MQFFHFRDYIPVSQSDHLISIEWSFIKNKLKVLFSFDFYFGILL